MNLSSAFNIISSSFAANAAQVAVVSNNIANVNTTGYSDEVANLLTNSYGGVDVASVTRDRQCGAPRAGLDLDVAGGGEPGDRRRARDARRNRRRQLHDVVDLRRGSERRLAIGDARQSAERADDLRRLADLDVGRRRRGHRRDQSRRIAERRRDAAVNQVREQADQDMASSVSTINSLLGQFQTANNAVVSGLASGANVAPPRTRAIRSSPSSSQQIGVTTTTKSNGSMSIYTDSGVTLFQNTAPHRLLHADDDLRRWRDRERRHGRRRADHRARRTDGDPVGRARRLRGAARHASRRSIRRSSTRSPAA